MIPWKKLTRFIGLKSKIGKYMFLDQEKEPVTWITGKGGQRIPITEGEGRSGSGGGLSTTQKKAMSKLVNNPMVKKTMERMGLKLNKPKNIQNKFIEEREEFYDLMKTALQKHIDEGKPRDDIDKIWKDIRAMEFNMTLPPIFTIVASIDNEDYFDGNHLSKRYKELVNKHVEDYESIPKRLTEMFEENIYVRYDDEFKKADEEEKPFGAYYHPATKDIALNDRVMEIGTDGSGHVPHEVAHKIWAEYLTDEQKNEFNKVYEKYKPEIEKRKIDRQMLHNVDEFHSEMFAEYTTRRSVIGESKVDDMFKQGILYLNPETLKTSFTEQEGYNHISEEAYYSNKYEEAFELLEKTYGTEGFKNG